MRRTAIEDYFQSIGKFLGLTEASDAKGDQVPLSAAIDWAVSKVASMKDKSNKVIFIGNGGSAAISSHMSIDYLKNGGVPALAFNDGAALTCLSNDLGYDQVFAKQIEMHGKPSDLVIAISSSGRSASILNGAKVARELGCDVYTLSGFEPDNPLRSMGRYNLYVPSAEYGFVEISHLVLCHAILDIEMGWRTS